ncbi:thioredoxin, mitochondrial [Anastrepha obliqua]|uniref:thioredoxin, mitochondrial n=1 Tax=Anastrepha obliqua TaxID=95512 RepID=UPI002409E66D|nr:thioredoxin, mitochondrial [Anastrepha obliqua]XP_054727164.1 thioredoxin, mitochondrial [Anastrepha obliqua]XP_054727165.1 thioredoxin, mitochondrial [Anastrepha obliqua]XP_054727166.1 thioredoxin, mitochondrial [Anastrepha obliqua]XP_054727167.1 thioredoxin, mitochondrial [Anastrepha obliqua]
MLKIVSQGVSQRIVAGLVGSAHNNYQRLPPSATKAAQKFISQSCCCGRKVVVKDHYEFDQKVINSDNPVVVNFHAEWCDPCKILTPKMSELLDDSEEIDLATIDVDSNMDLVETFEVKAVPAVLAFRNGVVVDKFIGLVDANIIEKLINKLKPKKQL